MLPTCSCLPLAGGERHRYLRRLISELQKPTTTRKQERAHAATARKDDSNSNNKTVHFEKIGRCVRLLAHKPLLVQERAEEWPEVVRSLNRQMVFVTDSQRLCARDHGATSLLCAEQGTRVKEVDVRPRLLQDFYLIAVMPSIKPGPLDRPRTIAGSLRVERSWQALQPWLLQGRLVTQ